MNDNNRLILNFHGLGEPHAGVEAEEIPYWCDTDVFYRLLDQIFQFSDPELTIEITFDDGNKSDIEIAAPALAERGLTGRFFINAGRLKHSEYLDVNDITALENLGMSIGSHGWSHVDLRTVGNRKLIKEAVVAVNMLNCFTTDPVESFAIPFGSYDRRVLGALKHFRTIYTSDGYRASSVGRIVPRVTYTREWTVETIKVLACEKYAINLKMKQRLLGTIKRLR